MHGLCVMAIQTDEVVYATLLSPTLTALRATLTRAHRDEAEAAMGVPGDEVPFMLDVSALSRGLRLAAASVAPDDVDVGLTVLGRATFTAVTESALGKSLATLARAQSRASMPVKMARAWQGLSNVFQLTLVSQNDDAFVVRLDRTAGLEWFLVGFIEASFLAAGGAQVEARDAGHVVTLRF
jgi:uncharacterized protein (TIGR02265 family)